MALTKSLYQSGLIALTALCWTVPALAQQHPEHKAAPTSAGQHAAELATDDKQCAFNLRASEAEVMLLRRPGGGEINDDVQALCAAFRSKNIGLDISSASGIQHDRSIAWATVRLWRTTNGSVSTGYTAGTGAGLGKTSNDEAETRLKVMLVALNAVAKMAGEMEASLTKVETESRAAFLAGK